MPVYDFVCRRCGESHEAIILPGETAPVCCGEVMNRSYGPGNTLVKIKYPLWVDRIDEIHKAQEQRGERLRFVYPSEVL